MERNKRVLGIMKAHGISKPVRDLTRAELHLVRNDLMNMCLDALYFRVVQYWSRHEARRRLAA